MITLQEMHQRVSCASAYDRMIRSVQPMCNYFGVNQFYISRIASSGHLGYFSSLGIHLPWHEFFFENIELMQDWPVLRHPENLKSECMPLKYSLNSPLNKVIETAWQKFNINFVVNIQRKVPEGIEQFGFGLKSNHPKAEQHVLNELPLLSKFIDFFYEENYKLIQLSFDHQVEISTLLGPCFYQRPSFNPISEEKNLLLKQLGLGKVLSLTSRELEVLKYLAHGYPATYIGMELHLSKRTVEHHIEAIKDKLNCKSKVALIKAAHEITSVIF